VRGRPLSVFGGLGTVWASLVSYFLLQNVLPHFGQASSTSLPFHQLPPRLFPVPRYADTGTGSPHLSHGLVVALCHQPCSHFNMTYKLGRVSALRTVVVPTRGLEPRFPIVHSAGSHRPDLNDRLRLGSCNRHTVIRVRGDATNAVFAVPLVRERRFKSCLDPSFSSLWLCLQCRCT
jgi:hypothetical protein